MSQDNGWYERGELPPIGTECEFYQGMLGWNRCKIAAVVFRDGGKSCIAQLENDWGLSRETSRFRPLKTEREKFVERLDKEWQSRNKSLSDFFAEQYDKGLRYIE